MKIGIAGLGKLGGALLAGLTLREGGEQPLIQSADICAFVKPERVDETERRFAVRAVSDLGELFENSEVIFLALKGRVFAELAGGVRRGALRGKTVVSLMAGVPFEAIRGAFKSGAEDLDEDFTLARAMPSLAIAERAGVIGYTKAPETVEALLNGLGYAFRVEPGDLEKVTAFSACGLGFAAYLIDAFAKAGRELGFSEKTCDRIAAVTFERAAARGGDFRELVAAVATKGGATERGVAHMDLRGIDGIVAEAVKKAYEALL
jgi:pyrroline-5-carboxylate reductase